MTYVPTTFTSRNLSTPPGVEPATLGLRSEHATSKPPEPTRHGNLRDLVAALWDKKLAFRTRERRKFWVFTDGPKRREKKTSSEAVLQLNSASEKESVLLKEDQTDL
ncbi:hypothetical protein TNCV_4025641 [Trichonephila clavipes]|nr:hypothetical protein TNCV_4025641 [Trichonephila clavipes]